MELGGVVATLYWGRTKGLRTRGDVCQINMGRVWVYLWAHNCIYAIPMT
jgi:hypothetical protein